MCSPARLRQQSPLTIITRNEKMTLVGAFNMDTAENGVILECGFRKISAVFLRNSSLRKGYRLFESGHVLSASEWVSRDSENVPDNGQTYVDKDNRKIAGKVLPQTSVRNKPYLVEIKLDNQRNVSNATCECRAGFGPKAKCKHVAAMVHYINNEETKTCTSEAQEWGKPSQSGLNKYKKGRSISDLFPKAESKVSDPLDVKSQPNSDLVMVICNSGLDCSLRNMLREEVKHDCEKAAFEVLDSVLNTVEETSSADRIHKIIPGILKDNRSVNCNR